MDINHTLRECSKKMLVDDLIEMAQQHRINAETLQSSDQFGRIYVVNA